MTTITPTHILHEIGRIECFDEGCEPNIPECKSDFDLLRDEAIRQGGARCIGGWKQAYALAAKKLNF